MSVIDGKRQRQAEYFAFCEEGADPSACIGGHRLVSATAPWIPMLLSELDALSASAEGCAP
jgi:hypothetical protein